MCGIINVITLHLNCLSLVSSRVMRLLLLLLTLTQLKFLNCHVCNYSKFSALVFGVAVSLTHDS